ncbi:pca operon transcription factor PcaQ [Pigmentiphaga soli]|uniref:Pca operon transcription factor PcaQ n=1 Tax=Pigmentiphaga soli TaxID=1007095 RepID=A0ABP8GKS6_9BURK
MTQRAPARLEPDAADRPPLSPTLAARLKLRQLSCFLEVAEGGSLGAAAARLCVTESAVSKTINELEDILGARLFERARKGMRPTAAGAEFGQRAREILKLLQTAADQAGSGRRVRPATLRMAAMPIASAIYLPAVLQGFVEHFPRCLVEVIVGPKDSVLDDLRKGAVDVIIGRLPPSEDMAGLAFEQIMLDQYVFAVAHNHPLARRKRLRMQDLLAHTLVTPPKQTVVWNEVQRLFLANGIGEPPRVIEILDLNFASACALRHKAVWIASRSFLRAQGLIGPLRVLPLDTAMLEAPIGLIRRAEAARDGAQALLAELVRRHRAAPPGEG